MFRGFWRIIFGGERRKKSFFADTHTPQQQETESLRKVASALTPATSHLRKSDEDLHKKLETERMQQEAEDRERRTKLQARLEAATDTDECVEIYEEAGLLNDDEGLQDAALGKGLLLALTPEDCQSIYEQASGDLEKKAVEKQEQIFLDRLAKAATTEECLEIYSEAEHDYGIDLDSNVVVRRALEVATSSDECKEIVDQFTFEREDKELETELYRKMISLFDSVEECQDLWNYHEIDSEFGRMAILRAAEIIQKENSEPKDSEPKSDLSPPSTDPGPEQTA